MQNTLYLSGIPNLKAGTQHPNCIYLDNRLYVRLSLAECYAQSIKKNMRLPTILDFWSLTNLGCNVENFKHQVGLYKRPDTSFTHGVTVVMSVCRLNQELINYLFWLHYISWHAVSCCGFWPANWWFKSHSLVKMVFLAFKHLFSVTNRKKEEKAQK